VRRPCGAARTADHFPDSARPDHFYQHVPEGVAEPSARPHAEVAAELAAWAAGAGLRPDAAALRALDDPDELAEVLIFDGLLPALGLPGRGEPRPYAFPAGHDVFKPMALLASRAYFHARAEEPVSPWEAAALTLERELWAGAYDPATDATDLARRAIGIWTGHRPSRAGAAEDVLANFRRSLAQSQQRQKGLPAGSA
jgi:hypothetical protein